MSVVGNQLCFKVLGSPHHWPRAFLFIGIPSGYMGQETCGPIFFPHNIHGSIQVIPKTLQLFIWRKYSRYNGDKALPGANRLRTAPLLYTVNKQDFSKSRNLKEYDHTLGTERIFVYKLNLDKLIYTLR